MIWLLTPARRMLRSISRGVAFIVLDHDDRDGQSNGFGLMLPYCSLPRKPRGNNTRKSSLGQARSHRDIAAQPPHQGPDMGEADALARPVLATGAAEQFEDALAVLLGDAAAIVLMMITTES